jgi:hypothetical protein
MKKKCLLQIFKPESLIMWIYNYAVKRYVFWDVMQHTCFGESQSNFGGEHISSKLKIGK